MHHRPVGCTRDFYQFIIERIPALMEEFRTSMQITFDERKG